MTTQQPGQSSQSVPEGSIVIPPAQLYGQLQQDIGVIRTVTEDLRVSLSGVPAQVADHEQRLRRLERALWLGVGFAAALGSAAGSIGSNLLGH